MLFNYWIFEIKYYYITNNIYFKNMKKILIVWAFSQELNPIKKEIKKLSLRDIKLSFLTTGMWNYNMILNLTKYLEQEDNFDFIINIWVCWYKEIKEDFIQVWRVLNLSNNSEYIIPNLISFWKLVSIASSENIITNNNDLKEEEYVDMESYWFEKVCENFKIARMILKIPVDKVWKETKNFDFKKAELYLEKNINYEELLEKISNYLNENKIENKDLSKYNNYFAFSFTQKIIFEKLYNKFEVLTWEDFEKYFYEYIRSLEELQNTKQESKKFLDKLDKYLEDK